MLYTLLSSKMALTNTFARSYADLQPIFCKVLIEVVPVFSQFTSWHARKVTARLENFTTEMVLSTDLPPKLAVTLMVVHVPVGDICSVVPVILAHAELDASSANVVATCVVREALVPSS